MTNQAVEAIELLEARRAQALIDADVVTLSEMTHVDYVHVDGRGQLRDKEAFLNSLSSGQTQSKSYTIEQNLVRIAGDTAIVTGVFHNEMTDSNACTFVRSGRHSRVYIYRDKHWLNILHQGTELTSNRRC